ncbi:MAG TPA: VOC family protein [Vicinamibacterales bacterium]|nr:VOC family protein [Vicinamibacterales bacterium]
MTEPQHLGEFNGFEIYPMPMFATISVADVSAVSEWYRNALGFGVVFSAPAGPGGQPAMVHLRRKKYQDVLIVPAQSAAAPSTASTISVSFSADDGEVDAIAERARSARPLGTSAIAGPIDTPWNTRDLRVTDPVGTRLVFTGRNPNADPEQMKRMQALLSAGKR